MINIRPACPSDVPALLNLMRALAKFEDYIEKFAVTKSALLSHGFGEQALFHTHLATSRDTPVGYAVTYVVPWTYTLCPRLVLKELYVIPKMRGSGVGRRLFSHVVEEAEQKGCDHVAWTVMTGNETAALFYKSLGGYADQKWLNWRLDL